MSAAYDIAVAGSGFAGSLMAMIARRLGLSVVLLEKGSHPRVVIGESSTPLSNLLLESLAERYDLPLLKPLTKWGSWQQRYPHVACGLKRGFSFVHHEFGACSGMGDGQLVVAASPNDTIADAHWYRADVDQALVVQAQALGAEYLDRFQVDELQREQAGWMIRGRRSGTPRTLRAKFLIDATGPRGLLHRELGLAEARLPNYPATAALYSHFSGVREFAQLAPGVHTPFPLDAAALHHVFAGGSIWVLRFNNGITSAGVAATAEVAARFHLAKKAEGWRNLLAELPQVREQFAEACAEMPFTYMPELSYRSAAVAGPGWAMLPSTAGFVDPLLSTGFSLTLLGITRLAALLEQDWESDRMGLRLAEYTGQTEEELLATSRLIAALYGNMGDFPTFRCLSLLYFAAASYAETVRRLGKPGLAGSFLLHDHPVFGPASRALLEDARGELDGYARARLQEEIYRLVEDFDVAGLGKRPRDHCYRVDAADLFASAHKVAASAAEIEAMLERAGFFASAT